MVQLLLSFIVFISGAVLMALGEACNSDDLGEAIIHLGPELRDHTKAAYDAFEALARVRRLLPGAAGDRSAG